MDAAFDRMEQNHVDQDPLASLAVVAAASSVVVAAPFAGAGSIVAVAVAAALTVVASRCAVAAPVVVVRDYYSGKHFSYCLLGYTFRGSCS